MKRAILLTAVVCLLVAYPAQAADRTGYVAQAPAHPEEKIDAQTRSPRARQMDPSPGQYRWLSEGKRTEIPFELMRNHVIMNVKMQGRPLSLVLDTGMPSHGVVLFGSARSDSLPLEYVGEAMVGGVGGGPTQARLATGATVELGELELTQQTVIVMPADRDRRLAFGERDGAIGYSLFSRFVVRIDFDRMVVSIQEAATGAGSVGARPDSAAVLPISFTNNYPRASCEVELLDGTVVPLEVLVDLGASHAVSINARAHPEIPIPEGSIEASLGRGVGGTLVGQVGRIKSLSLGGRRLDNVIASFRTKAHEAPRLEEMVRDGNLGADALRRFNVTFDYRNKVMLLEPNSHTKEPFEFDMSGLEYSRTPEGLLGVDRVILASPASEAGLSVGDVIAKVDGDETAVLTLDGVRKSFTEPGKKVTLVFLRDGKEKQVTLTLRRLL